MMYICQYCIHNYCCAFQSSVYTEKTLPSFLLQYHTTAHATIDIAHSIIIVGKKSQNMVGSAKTNVVVKNER